MSGKEYHGDEFYGAFDGNPCHDNMGRLEELEAEVIKLTDGLCKCFAILVNKDIVTFAEVADKLSDGYLIKDNKPEG